MEELLAVANVSWLQPNELLKWQKFSFMSCQEHIVSGGKLNTPVLKWKQRSFASNVAEVKLSQFSYLPFTCKLHRHLYAPLLQLLQLVILIFSVSCISSTCSYQNVEGPQAEDLAHWGSVKLLPVCNKTSQTSGKRTATQERESSPEQWGIWAGVMKMWWENKSDTEGMYKCQLLQFTKLL